MLENFLLEKYGYNEPIFLNELSVPNMSANATRQAFKRLVDAGFLKRYDTGIYYIPKQSKLLDNSYLDPYMVILRKYVKDDTDTFGYITGAGFANQLGLTSQMPAVTEIVTNKESTKGRTVVIGGQTVRVKKSTVFITKENARLLQFLDTVSQAERYSEVDEQETITRLKFYIKKCCFKKDQLAEVAVALTGNTAKKLIEWGMIYDFTS